MDACLEQVSKHISDDEVINIQEVPHKCKFANDVAINVFYRDKIKIEQVHV